MKRVGGTFPFPFGVGILEYRLDRAFDDVDSDGIPDELERSSAFNQRLNELYPNFSGLDPNRMDLLLDVRMVGSYQIPPSVVNLITRRFRENGIHLQWLEHPERFDIDEFDRDFGYNARKILWSPRSFYTQTIEEFLKDVAFQLIVAPGKLSSPKKGMIYSPWVHHVIRDTREGWINGMNVGNRAVVGSRSDPKEAARLILHEIGHLALCHDTSPDNIGVMGTGERIDFMPFEWEIFRENLDNIRDTTGFDVSLRHCLWFEHANECCSEIGLVEGLKSI